MAIQGDIQEAWGDTTRRAEETAKARVKDAHLQGLNLGLPEAGLDPQVSPDPRALRFAERHAARAVRRVSTDMRDEIVTGVQTALREGRRQEAVEAAIRDAFDGEAWRIPVISRTELNRAHNWARMAAWSKTSVVQAKEWLTAGDERVRPSHEDIHGERVPKDVAFSIGVQAPPGGPNCRCTLIPVTEMTGFQPPHTATGSIFGLARLEEELVSGLRGVFRAAARRVADRFQGRAPASEQRRGRAPGRVVA